MIARHALWGVDLAQMLPLSSKVLRDRSILIQINMIDGRFWRDLRRQGANDTALGVDFGKLLLLELNVLAQLLALAREIGLLGIGLRAGEHIFAGGHRQDYCKGADIDVNLESFRDLRNAVDLSQRRLLVHAAKWQLPDVGQEPAMPAFYSKE
jgi:hypothetical protein